MTSILCYSTKFHFPAFILMKWSHFGALVQIFSTLTLKISLLFFLEFTVTLTPTKKFFSVLSTRLHNTRPSQQLFLDHLMPNDYWLTRIRACFVILRQKTIHVLMPSDTIKVFVSLLLLM